MNECKPVLPQRKECRLSGTTETKRWQGWGTQNHGDPGSSSACAHTHTHTHTHTHFASAVSSVCSRRPQCHRCDACLHGRGEAANCHNTFFPLITVCRASPGPNHRPAGSSVLLVR